MIKGLTLNSHLSKILESNVKIDDDIFLNNIGLTQLTEDF